MTIQNLAFEGGGVWGVAYAGALKVLDEKSVLPQIQRVAGTSAGSIVALLLALRYSAEEIKDKLWQIDFSKFKDMDLLDAADRYGLYKGNVAFRLIQGFISEKLDNPDATFEDLNKAQGRDLRVFATNLSRQQVQEFSFEKSPKISIAIAVRASMSIPLFFEAVKIYDDIFVDGGIVFAYPFLSFGDDKLEDTLGLAFDHAKATKQGPVKTDALDYGHLIKYATHLLHSMSAAQAAVWMMDKGVQRRTILIDTGDVYPTEFTLSQEKKQMLFDNGAAAATAFFAKQK